MRRRLVLVLATVLTALGSFGAVAAQASPTDDVQPPSVSATTSSSYWACIALDHVEIGACLRNPLPDPSGLPSARQVVYDASGVRV